MHFKIITRANTAIDVDKLQVEYSANENIKWWDNIGKYIGSF